jgi:hypothetical protein
MAVGGFAARTIGVPKTEVDRQEEVGGNPTEVRHDRRGRVSRTSSRSMPRIGATIADVEREFGTGGYGAFKSAVADAVVEYLRPVRERFAALAADPGEVDRLLAIGADTATGMSDAVLARASKAAGLLPRATPR